MQRKSNQSMTSFFVINTLNNNISIKSYSSLLFKKYYSIYFSPELTNNSHIYNAYNNYSKDIKSKRMRLNDNIVSCVRFKNEWATVQFGRDKAFWGAGENIDLALNNHSSSYNYFLLGSDYGAIRVNYINGFLEKKDDQINRFLIARGIEWTNKESLVLGFSETIIYSGFKRKFDFSYLNPISSHLEVELNDRLYLQGNSNSNAVWQFHLDWLIQKNKRISLNYLYDELVLDKKIQIGKEHGRAYSLRISYTPVNKNGKIITLIGENIFIGTPTFRHGNGYNNFVLNSMPLGWPGGSDLLRRVIGIKTSNKNLFFSLEYGFIKKGVESITERPYEKYFDYLESSFPSGDYTSDIFFKNRFEWFYKKRISFIYDFTVNKNKETIILLGIQSIFPIHK